MSGELDRLRFPSRETEAGLLRRVPGAPAAAHPRPARSSRRPPSTPAGGRRIEEVRLGPARPRARGRRLRGRRAVARPGPGPLESAGPACPAPPPQVSAVPPRAPRPASRPARESGCSPRPVRVEPWAPQLRPALPAAAACFGQGGPCPGATEGSGRPQPHGAAVSRRAPTPGSPRGGGCAGPWSGTRNLALDGAGAGGAEARDKK